MKLGFFHLTSLIAMLSSLLASTGSDLKARELEMEKFRSPSGEVNAIVVFRELNSQKQRGITLYLVPVNEAFDSVENRLKYKILTIDNPQINGGFGIHAFWEFNDSLHIFYDSKNASEWSHHELAYNNTIYKIIDEKEQNQSSHTMPSGVRSFRSSGPASAPR